MYTPPAQPVAPAPYRPPARTQTAALPPATPAAPPAPSPAAPVVSAGYRAALAAWLESHKQYPEGARQRGEQGSAVLHFRVERDGRVLSYSLARSTGYPDLDAELERMMRGARLPPFPGDMAASDIDVSVTIRFALTR